MHNWRGGFVLNVDGVLRCRRARMQEEPSAKPQQTDKSRKGEMQSHLPSGIVGCEVTRVNPEPGRASFRCKDTRREHARIFGAALRILSREINFASSPDTLLSLLRSFSLPFLLICARLCSAVGGFCACRSRLASNSDLPARFGRFTEGRLGFRPYGFREGCPARPAKPRGTQLARLGAACAGRDGFRDQAISSCFEIEAGFCAGPREFRERAHTQGRLGWRAP